jgi:hypothetical protein
LGFVTLVLILSLEGDFFFGILDGLRDPWVAISSRPWRKAPRVLKSQNTICGSYDPQQASNIHEKHQEHGSHSHLVPHIMPTFTPASIIFSVNAQRDKKRNFNGMAEWAFQTSPERQDKHTFVDSRRTVEET